MKRTILVLLAVSLSPFFAYAQTINLTPANATILFQVEHDFGFTTGVFNDFSGSIEVDENKKITLANARVQINSLQTYNPIRNEGLLSKLFLDAQKFPEASYENGQMTIRGITKPVELIVEEGQVGKMIIQASFDRNDFGIKFNKNLADKKKLIGNKVKLRIQVKLP